MFNNPLNLIYFIISKKDNHDFKIKIFDQQRRKRNLKSNLIKPKFANDFKLEKRIMKNFK